MPADPEGRSRLARIMARLRRQAAAPTDGDRLRGRIERLTKLERLASDLDRLEARYGDPPKPEQRR